MTITTTVVSIDPKATLDLITTTMILRAADNLNHNIAFIQLTSTAQNPYAAYSPGGTVAVTVADSSS